MDQDPWLTLIRLLGMLLALACIFAGLSSSMWLMIWPVERRWCNTKGTFRFRLIDLICLLVYWQSILAAWVAAVRGIEGPGANAAWYMDSSVAVVAAILGAAIWGVSVSVLSRAGIESSARRAAFILITIPGSIAVPVTFVLSAVATINYIQFAVSDPANAIPAWIPLALFAASVAAVFLLRLLSLWIASDARTA